ncbi:MAG TPA: 6-phosphogluconolactonase [Gallionella sp.]|nr:6-phosphogluconolactonase [Gallionella sp.]
MNINNLPHAQLVLVYEDLDQLSSAVARRIAEAAQLAIAARGVFRLALAGGETPRHCYEKLRRLGIDWQRVQIYFGDERCLPNGDPQRNDSMAQKALLDHVVIPAGNIHFIPAEQGAYQAANRYAAVLASNVPLDLVLLGMGEDGHTASLFPNNPAVESAASVVAVFNAPKPPAERVSLGLNTLNEARQKIFLVAGAAKRKALEQMLLGINLPAARVTSAEWHLDSTAAT